MEYTPQTCTLVTNTTTVTSNPGEIPTLYNYAELIRAAVIRVGSSLVYVDSIVHA